ncbi:efflux RND transporter periplasmic adaptor subunit [Legionella londiniensis]
MERTKTHKISRIAALVLALFLLIYLIVHMGTKNKTPTLPTPAVVVQKPMPAKRADYITQTGNTVAFNSVNLVARVEGYLQEINFTDGSFVKKGTVLFVIEPEPYKEQLEAAEATVAAQKAQYLYAKTEAARQRDMYKQNATSLKNVEKWEAKTEEAKAEVAKDEANARQAAINYSYTHVLAPFDGRIGRHLVDTGNLVGHGEATKLAVIEQINPIYVYFNLNELDLITLREAARAHGFKPSEINQISVDVRMQNQSDYPYKGKLDFVSTGLNASTGTMQFRALLPNNDYALLPGLFVEVRIPVTKPRMQLTVPDTAVQYDQIGPYLLVVNHDNIVVLKRVVLGSVEQGIRAVKKGLAAEDWVIVNGLQNATPGQLVKPETQMKNNME